MVELFKPEFDWRTLLRENGATSQLIRNTLDDVCEVLSAYGRDGIQDANTCELSQPQEYLHAQRVREQAIAAAQVQFAAEQSGGGFITPDMLPNFFGAGPTYKPTKNYIPDTSYLDFMVQRRMVDELEDRKEWDADIQFVLMKKEGQVRYATLLDSAAQMTNDEWGSGIKIWRTWFETNKFGIKMSALAPKFRYAYFDQIADIIYGQVQAGVTTAITGATNMLVPDINTATLELIRYENSFDKTPFESANFRIIAPIEMERFLPGAFIADYGLGGYSERLLNRVSVTYTPKLPFVAAAAVCYVVVDNWEQNEYATRVPFGVYGTADDIDTFAQKISYRGAYGSNIDVNSGRELTFNTTSAFYVSTPMPVDQI